MRAPFLPVPKPDHKRRKPTRRQRNNFSPSVRLQIRQRDGEICRECGIRRATQIHHVVPRSRGGRGLYTNGISLCHQCHAAIHQDYSLMQKWQEKFEQKYGRNYYKDEWDLCSG